MSTRTTRFIVIMGVGILLAAAPVWAHHVIFSQFDVNKPITLRGTLTKMEWVNPHGWIYVDVKGPDGTVEGWAIETGSPYGLVRRGLTMTDFTPGIEIIVEGFVARNGTPTAAGETVTFPDRQLAFDLGRGWSPSAHAADRRRSARVR